MDSTSQKRERHQRARALYEAALDQPSAQRPAFVHSRSTGDPEMEREVLKLLRSADSAQQGGFLQTPAFKRAPAEANVQSGMRFGPYKVIRRLDAGGMGSVYLTLRADEAFQRVAALKIIRPDCLTDDLLRRFQQERQILAELDHPNIARILDGGTTQDGLPYFVMDYVEGLHIDAYCAQNRATVESRLRLFIQVCRAVEYLHHNRVIHRDLKPSNILVTANGTVKLVDFGIAKVLREGLPNAASQNAASQNPTTQIILTPAYASPEQLLGRPAGPSSDVYSLGVIFCELLTGCKPHATDAGKSVVELVAAVTTSEPRAPSTLAGTNPAHISAENPAQLRRRLTGDLDNVLLMALRREPQRRYSTAGEFAEDLQRYLDGRPVAARKDGLIYRTGKFTRRNWIAVSGIAAGAALLAWGIDERLEREKLELRIRQLEDTARREAARAQTRQNALQAQITNTNAGRLYQEQIADLRQMGMVFQDSLTESIRLKPGMTPARRELVDQASAYMDRASTLVAGDAESDLALAQAYLWLGDLRGYPDHPNLNDGPGALEMYQRARRLLAAQAGDPRAGSLIAEVETHAGTVR